MKKTLVTILSLLCMAFVGTGAAMLGNDKLATDSVVAETETQTTYETPENLGLSDLMWDFSGDYIAEFYSSILTDEGKKYDPPSSGTVIAQKKLAKNYSSVDLKFDWKGNVVNGASIVFEMEEMKFAIRPLGNATNMQFNIEDLTGSNQFPQKTYAYTEWHTYEIIKTYKTDDENHTFLFTLKVDGEQVYSAEHTGKATTLGVLKISYWQNTNWLRETDRGGSSEENLIALETPVIKDVAEINENLVMKTTNSEQNKYFFAAGNTAEDFGTRSAGVTFRMTAKRSEWGANEGLTVRFGNNFMVRFRRGPMFNLFYNTDKSGGLTWSGSPIQKQYSFVDGVEHEYTIVRQENKGTAGGWVITIKEDGDVKQCVWIKEQPDTEKDFIHCFVQNNSCESTLRSAKYYGVKKTVDGVSKIEKVEKGTEYTLAYTGDKIMFGWKNGSTLLEDGAKITDEAEVTALVLGAHNEKGASLRWLHEGTASLKWETVFDKSDLDAVKAYFGEENVSLGYEISAKEDSSKTIKKLVTETVVNDDGESFSVLLSNIKADHYAWSYSTRFFVKIGETEYSVANNENEASLKTVASLALNDTSATQTEEYKYLAEEGVYSKYTEAQRTILSAYAA